MHRSYCMLCLLAFAALPAKGDSVTLRGGDVLRGRLVTIAGGAMLFRTNLAGQIMTPLDEVASLKTDGEAAITLVDDTELRGRLVIVDDTVTVTSADGAEKTTGKANVATIIPIDFKTDSPAPALPEPRAITGSWEMGVDTRLGEDSNETLYARLELAKDWDDLAFDSEWTVETRDADTFPYRFRGRLAWDAKTAQRLGPAFGLEFELDRDKALALRGVFHAGVSTDSIDAGGADLRFGAGLGFEAARFDAQLRSDSERPGNIFANERTRRTECLHLRLGLRFLQSLSKGRLEEDFALYVPPSDLDTWRARADTSVSWPMSDRLRLKLNLLLDYQNQPAFSDLDRFRATFGAGMAWDF